MNCSQRDVRTHPALLCSPCRCARTSGRLTFPDLKTATAYAFRRPPSTPGVKKKASGPATRTPAPPGDLTEAPSSAPSVSRRPIENAACAIRKRKEQRVCIAALPKGETGLTRAEYRPRSATRHGYPRRRVHEASAGPHSGGIPPSFGNVAWLPRRRTRTTHTNIRRREASSGRSLARLSSRSPRTLRLRAWLRQGALPPRPPQGGVAPLTRTSCPPWGPVRKGSARAEYRPRSANASGHSPKTRAFDRWPLPGKSAMPAAVPDLRRQTGRKRRRFHTHAAARDPHGSAAHASPTVANGLTPSAPAPQRAPRTDCRAKKDGDRQTPHLGRCGGASFRRAGITPPPLQLRRTC